MAFKLMNLFGRSQERDTINLIKQLMKKIIEANTVFVEVKTTFDKKDYANLSKLSNKIGDIEHQADELRRRILTLLCEGAFLPMMRENLHRLVQAMDDVVDEFEDASQFLVYTRKDLTPLAVRNYIIQMMEKTIDSIKLLDQIVNNTLDNKKPQGLIQQVYQLESEVDDIRNKAYEEIFLKNKLKDPVTQQVTRLAIARVANVTNKIEDVCDEIQTLRMSRGA